MTARALPFMRTTASGLPVAATASTRFFFRLRQIDAGAISAKESRFVDRHLFAFELARDSHYGDHDIRVFRGSNGFRRRRIVAFAQISSACGSPFRPTVHDTELTFWPFSRCTRPNLTSIPPLLLNASLPACHRPWFVRSRRREFRGGSRRSRRREESRPVHEERFFFRRLRRQILAVRLIFGSTRVAIGAGVARPRPASVMNSLYSAFRPGFPSGVVRSVRHRGSISAQELGSRNKGDSAFGNSAFRPSSMETVCVGVPA